MKIQEKSEADCSLNQPKHVKSFREEAADRRTESKRMHL